ncbi:ABC transporter substrate-binding protein [Haliangium ochraceum]|uniref:Extracellular solute-binding protein family 1 n=1 Tax=Haliangium ochraceum (strain DSM 14365 / JCM 11303 / SMP-2) TaxID=502025 RepID=D0LSE9_HALO1|nr:ABC transporter substrate-binding protein [Haliangium ochraceum]ACY15648.1 extracellular solute-binding protein family 1 [Haliangium ochraceum DSM 14365]
MKKLFSVLLACATIGAWGCDKKDEAAGTETAATTEEAKEVTISLSCGAVGQELELCKKSAEEWSKKTGNKVNIISTPNGSTDRLALYQQILGAASNDIDVFQIDVVWPGVLASHFLDLKPHLGGAESEFFPALIENNTVGDKLVALPWFTDAGVLYYRKDLLEKYGAEPPTTWAEMAETAKKIQDGEREAGNDGMWGYVFQGKAYEGLTCNGLEWVHSFGGGTIVDESGKVTINNPQAAQALDTAAGWIGTIAPEGVLNYAEEEARSLFQSGNAVFMRNWPYAWGMAQADDNMKDKVGVIALPKGGDGGTHAATLGGWGLAVSKYTKNEAAAADLVKHLTSAEVQKMRAIEGSFNPTIDSLYKDQQVLEATPFFGTLYETFANAAVPRPAAQTGSKYNQVSNAFWNASYDVLSGKTKAADSLAELETKLNDLSRGGSAW